MEFRVLGPLEVIVGDQNVALGGSRERALLALLLLSPNEVVSSDRLVDEIWGSRASETAIHTLRVTMSRLRKTLDAAGGDGVLVTRAPGYLARVGPGELDTAQFDALVTRGRQDAARGDHEQAAAIFAEALRLWRGPALADLTEDFSFAHMAATRLEETRLSALEERIEADLACGRHRDVLPELETLARTHPLRERLWAQRMLALYRAGRQAEALRAYQELRSLLGDELGIEPNATLQRLETAILRHEPELDLAPAPAEGALPLPVLLTDMGRIFVGRNDELNRLQRIWDRAATGTVEVVLLGGEPGIGKTRLAAELATRVHAAGAVVLAGRCDEDLGVPYQPFVEALRHFVDHRRLYPGRLGRYGGELARLVPELVERVPGLPAPLRSDPETERYRLFDAVASWLATASVEAPLLLVLDDLHWAAKPTLLLLRHVVRAADGRALLLSIYRDSELPDDHPLADVVADLRRQGRVERLSLAGLDDMGVKALVEAASGRTLDEDGLALARTVYEETEGNPFFVREVLRHLAESGAVERGEAGWTTRRPVDQLGIPEGVREVVSHRLSRLSSDTNRVLRTAAVIGPELELGILQAAGDLSEEKLIGALEEAIAARVVTELAAGRFRFAHALVRATIYDSITATRKVALHRRVADAIEVVHAGVIDDHLPALAYHWARASAPAADTARAVDYATRAGDRALAQLAHDEAVGYYRQALDLLGLAAGSDQAARRLELLISLGEAQRRTGDPAHRETLLEAVRLARTRRDGDALARAALANSRGVYSSALVVDDERVAVLEEAVEAVGEADSSTRARLLADLGLELTFSRQRQRCHALSQEALRIARRLGDAATLAHVLTSRIATIWEPATLVECLSNVAELVAVAAQIGDPVTAARAHWLGYRMMMEAGEVGKADCHLQRAEALTAQLGQPTLQWMTLWSRGGRVLLAGQIGAAERFFDEAFQLGQHTGQPDSSTYYAVQQFQLRFEQGRLAEVEESFSAAYASRPVPFLAAFLARLHSELDHQDRARRLMERMADPSFADIPLDPGWVPTLLHCAAVASRLHDVVRARALHDLLAPYPDRFSIGGGVIIGCVAHYLGLLATTLDRYDEAEGRFAAAAGTHDRIGAPIWLARTRLEWARMLRTRGQPGDAERAREFLAQALVTAREIGVAKIERDAVALLE